MNSEQILLFRFLLALYLAIEEISISTDKKALAFLDRKYNFLAIYTFALRIRQ